MTTLHTGASRMSATGKRHAFIFDRGGLYTDVSMFREIRRRRAAMIVLAAGGEPFEVRTARKCERHQAVAIRPLTACRLEFSHGPIVCAALAPDYFRYRAFRGIPDEGILALPPSDFAFVEGAAGAVCAGALGREDALALFERLTEAAASHLPLPRPLSTRAESVIALLRDDVDCSLGDLAGSLHLSYYRMSHLIADGIGLPLRSYQLWRRLHRALAIMATGSNQTTAAQAAGFNDTSHFHRVCIEEYGVRPSLLMRDGVGVYLERSGDIGPRTRSGSHQGNRYFSLAS